MTPVHFQNAFLESEIHDWSWNNGVFKYFSRVSDGDIWLLFEFKSRGNSPFFEMLESMTENERKDLFDEIGSEYCVNCGRKTKRCFCMRDE
ncbi:hypothetical protein [Rosistilla oblonga]|uniref:hypothetical protein n=1 Tax=Rosistilla oblonga TaxID=2527990 RepID=UPI003A97C4A9